MDAQAVGGKRHTSNNWPGTLAEYQHRLSKLNRYNFVGENGILNTIGD